MHCTKNLGLHFKQALFQFFYRKKKWNGKNRIDHGWTVACVQPRMPRDNCRLATRCQTNYFILFSFFLFFICFFKIILQSFSFLFFLSFLFIFFYFLKKNMIFFLLKKFKIYFFFLFLKKWKIFINIILKEKLFFIFLGHN